MPEIEKVLQFLKNVKKVKTGFCLVFKLNYFFLILNIVFSVDGEESDKDFMNMLLGALGGGQTYEEEEDDGEENLLNLMNSLSQLNDLLGNIIEDAEENGYADDEEIDEEASREVDDAIDRLGDLVSQLGALVGTDGDEEDNDWDEDDEDWDEE